MERENGIGIDIDRLVKAMRAVDEAGRLFDEALAVYQARGPKRTSEEFNVAGGPVQTLQGAEEMALGARRFLAELALIAGYRTAGLDDRVGGRGEAARTGFAAIRGGGSRMARPLLDPTLRGLRLLLAPDLFDPAFKAEIEEVVNADQATYPAPSTFRIPAPVPAVGRTP
ncbi:hypothetical protein [Streptomyces sp. ISL-94]|uniref:hypothetical protein n=1 Tax=Streptomyces sp. ISL-94 TaxID=2819190 RepID=UPI001BE86154|nr:hypothetical protein [Streptomyces sp. ISL-94]MBT2480121.1 hypothetical protein [Streptomyces sp. ISL-94]